MYWYCIDIVLLCIAMQDACRKMYYVMIWHFISILRITIFQSLRWFSQCGDVAGWWGINTLNNSCFAIVAIMVSCTSLSVSIIKLKLALCCIYQNGQHANNNNVRGWVINVLLKVLWLCNHFVCAVFVCVCERASEHLRLIEKCYIIIRRQVMCTLNRRNELV